ncbi:succinate dehydrogenase, hydrophobic membrane anchor protein [Thioalkalivibrio sp. ALE16]|uniref:succinate dehydrogenase, hydrophobic membrane anchor protein n=1 Tax=Thioalkalivibrio sp. ALE16 TaxID=1158172 RepID=UPI00036B6BC5|nr:succinate dehydrogenase, hydrophobic membrane anchor protein [Thioalkalivibrio sp. ALE16]
MKLLSGQRAWLLQRITAVYVGVYVILALGFFVLAAPADHAAWLAVMGHPVVGLLTAVFVLLLWLHAWIGLRDVVMDYVQAPGSRLVVFVLGGGGLLLTGLWAFFILIRAGLA